MLHKLLHQAEFVVRIVPQFSCQNTDSHYTLTFQKLYTVSIANSYKMTSSWTTYSGLRDQNIQDKSVQMRTLKTIITHPNYNDLTNDYDISLLELSQPLDFSNTVHPVCLPAASHVFAAGSSCFVTGWGTLREGGQTACAPQG